jgi:glycosyltransferase involved in cell wall biosynthesis
MTFTGQNIICFAGEDWWFHNPHSNLHIMKEWARDNRVLFVNSPGIRMPDFKKDKFAGKRVFKKLRSLLRFVKQAEPNIWVFTPFAIPMVPRHRDRIARFNKAALLLQIRFLMRWLKLTDPILWVTVLVATEAAITLRATGGRCLVYYCVDNTPHFPGVDSAYMLGLENLLHRSADLAFFTNETLLAERQGFNPHTYYTGHGVDYEHFAQAQPQAPALPVPPELADITGPIAGYMGEINSLDIDLLKFVANDNPDVTFVFVGEIYADMDVIAELRNVRFLGKRTYAELPAYLRRFDACCLYYKTNATFNNYRNPKKLLEYLATGKPVVSVEILELRRYRDTVRIAETPMAYSALLRDALHRDTDAQRDARIALARDQTWTSVAARIGERIVERIEHRDAGEQASATAAPSTVGERGAA